MIPENVFKEWEKQGISVTELQDVVEVRHHGEVIARFSPLIPFDALRRKVQKTIEESIDPEKSLSNEQRRIDR